MIRIAMWSGPRNISTALMRAWGNRPDTLVCDEPFYAHYLSVTGLKHPLAEEIIARGETDWRRVVELLSSVEPPGKRIFYQKQMTHHLLPEIQWDWLARVSNCFLIRDPREVILSYVRKNYDPTPEDLGFPQQAAIYDWVQSHCGYEPPIIDARDVLQDPRRMLQRLCEHLHVPFLEAMLSWPPGLRETDGIWAPHWYTEVIHSTSFQPYQAKEGEVPEHLLAVYKTCLACYQPLFERRLRICDGDGVVHAAEV